MSNAQRIEAEMSSEHKVQESRERQAPAPERLAALPLEALLYYILYGDEGLTRLT